MKPKTVREIFLRLQAANPNPTTELVYHSPFELLIAVILSAQATDVSVNKATAKLYAVANTPETILALRLDGLKSYIKTIGLYNSKAFGEPTIAVDTHIFRIANRIGLADAKTVDGVEQQLLKVIPSQFKLDAHHWLILHGRYICIARKPKCTECLLRDLCQFQEKTLS